MPHITTTANTVEDAANAWLKRCTGEALDNQTIKTYRSEVRNHILPRLGRVPLGELRRADIKEFVEETPAAPPSGPA